MQTTHAKRLIIVFGSILLCISVQTGIWAFSGVFSQSSDMNRLTRNAALSPVPIPTEHPFHPVLFETGMVHPDWSITSYSIIDRMWQRGLDEIHAQTGARWIEIPVLFWQDALDSTHVTHGESTASVESVVAGIRAAHAHGYHVFLVPLFHVQEEGAWAGSIRFYARDNLSIYEQEVQWFDSFWQVFQPYVIAARIVDAEQVAIGTELVWLQSHAPDSLWEMLIARVRGAFPRTITYDMDWSSLYNPTTPTDPYTPPPTWLRTAHLDMIGVSVYIPLSQAPKPVKRAEIVPLWRDAIKSLLDKLSLTVNKPVLISEIGYRNSSDALYQPWDADPSKHRPSDPSEQAAACDAALMNVLSDPYIAGIFFWGWRNVQAFNLADSPAARVIHRWYTSPQALSRMEG